MNLIVDRVIEYLEEKHRQQIDLEKVIDSVTNRIHMISRDNQIGNRQRIHRDLIRHIIREEIQNATSRFKFSFCPNTTNHYHHCNEYCLKKYGNVKN